MAAAYKEQLDGIARKLMSDAGAKGARVGGKGRPKKNDRGEANPPHPYPDRAPQSRTKAGKRFGVGEKGVDADVFSSAAKGLA